MVDIILPYSAQKQHEGQPREKLDRGEMICILQEFVSMLLGKCGGPTDPYPLSMLLSSQTRAKW
jgi:hypothetical protein